MTLSIVILPAKVLADGTHKIRVSIAHNGTTRYIPTRFVVPTPDCLKNGVVTNKVSNASYINQQLRAFQTRIYKAYDEIEDVECYSCSQLIQLLNDKLYSNKVKTFKDVADEWLQVKRASCAGTTFDLYKTSADTFIEFAGRDFLISLLTPKKVWEYDAYLVKRKISDTTINIKMSALRGVINLAINRKYVSYDVNPFDEYKTRNSIIRDCVVPVDVIRKIRNYKPNTFCEQRAKDCFMLSFYLAGMNLADLMELDFSGDNVSFIRVKTIRRRTDNIKTEFTIQPEAREIINKYIDKNGRLKFSLSRKDISKQTISGNISINMKVLAKSVGYDGKLIFYSARKTFAQLSFLHNVQERVIAYCIGDSIKKNEVMSHYVSANKQLADECIRKVLDFVNSDLTEDDLIQGLVTRQ